MEDGMVDMFDHIEDLLDFPGDEDVFGLLEPCGSEGDALLLPRLPVPDSEVLGDGVGEDSLDGFTVPNRKSGIEFSKEDDKLDHWDELDIVQLEWMSNFLDDSESFSLGLTGGVDTVDKSLATSYDSHGETKAIRRCYFRTSSPVSVLEANTNVSAGGIRESYSSSSAYSSSSTTASHFIGSKKDARASPPPLSPPDQSPAALLVPARARTKRGRPAAYSPLLHVRVIPCSIPVAAVPSPLSAAASYACAYTSDPESFGESSFRAPPQPPPNKKSKKTHPTGEGNDSGPPAAVRKCMHCAITKTPQWRAGPLGPKTLCNACGVRYKSGRLFPEYRPAGSPTFVPSVHSNSHKKVVEMRMKAKHSATVTDGCDLLEYIRRRA